MLHDFVPAIGRQRRIKQSYNKHRRKLIDSNNITNDEDNYGPKSLGGMLDKYQWYLREREKEFGKKRKWDKTMEQRSRQQSIEEKWFKHITNNIGSQ